MYGDFIFQIFDILLQHLHDNHVIICLIFPSKKYGEFDNDLALNKNTLKLELNLKSMKLTAKSS